MLNTEMICHRVLEFWTTELKLQQKHINRIDPQKILDNTTVQTNNQQPTPT